MTKGKHWTNQQENELKILEEANSTVEEIAAKLQKSPGAIFYQMSTSLPRRNLN